MENALKFCHDFQNPSGCTRRACNYLHTSKEEEELYFATGTLPRVLVERHANVTGSTVTSFNSPVSYLTTTPTMPLHQFPPPPPPPPTPPPPPPPPPTTSTATIEQPTAFFTDYSPQPAPSQPFPFVFDASRPPPSLPATGPRNNSAQKRMIHRDAGGPSHKTRRADEADGAYCNDCPRKEQRTREYREIIDNQRLENKLLELKYERKLRKYNKDVELLGRLLKRSFQDSEEPSAVDAEESVPTLTTTLRRCLSPDVLRILENLNYDTSSEPSASSDLNADSGQIAGPNGVSGYRLYSNGQAVETPSPHNHAPPSHVYTPTYHARPQPFGAHATPAYAHTPPSNAHAPPTHLHASLYYARAQPSRMHASPAHEHTPPSNASVPPSHAHAQSYHTLTPPSHASGHPSTSAAPSFTYTHMAAADATPPRLMPAFSGPSTSTAMYPPHPPHPPTDTLPSNMPYSRVPPYYYHQ